MAATFCRLTVRSPFSGVQFVREWGAKMNDVGRDALAEAVTSLRMQAGRLYHIANKVVTTAYALEIRSVAAALDAEADRIAALAQRLSLQD